MRGILQRQGLTTGQVKANRQKYGTNLLTPPKREPWWQQFLDKFNDPVVRILMLAAVLALIIGSFRGEYSEAVGIIFAIVLATMLAFLNEFKANKEFDILNQVNDEEPVKVIRDGELTTVPKKELVVGDVVLVEAGEEIPADGKVIHAVSLQIDESRLTGESVPVPKAAETQDFVAQDSAEQQKIYPVDQVLRGTMVADGYGTIELTAVGDQTEIGQAACAATSNTEEQTPLNTQLEKLSQLIGIVAFGVAAVTFIVILLSSAIGGELNLTFEQWYFTVVLMLSGMIAGRRVWLSVFYSGLELVKINIKQPEWLEDNSLMGWLKTIGLGLVTYELGLGIGYTFGLLPEHLSECLPLHAAKQLLNYFMIAVTIIVVAVPEGLTMSVTLSLAYSMRKMTAANNLVRRLNACEAIGAITVICSDKTGTLTLNEMRLHEANFPCLNTQQIAKQKEPSYAQKLIAEAISANTTANLTKKPRQPLRPVGNPTEGALLLWLNKRNIDYIRYRANFTITYQWTFSSERKYMATLGVSAVTGHRILHVKGAPEIVLGRCAHILTQSGVEPIASHTAALAEALVSYQARGMRTLAFAYHDAPLNPIPVNEINKP